MTASGEVNLSSYYGESETLHVAFFYHIDKYDAGLKNSRTGVWFTDIQAFRQEGDTRTGILQQTESEIHIVNGASYATDATPSDSHTEALRFIHGVSGVRTIRPATATPMP